MPFKLPKSRKYHPRPECEIQPEGLRPSPIPVLLAMGPLLIFLAVFFTCLMLAARSDPPAHKAAVATRALTEQLARDEYLRRHPEPTVGQLVKQAAASSMSILESLKNGQK